MKKSIIGAIAVAACILTIAGCSGTPPSREPASATAQAQTPSQPQAPSQPQPPEVEQSKSLILDNASNHLVVKGDTLSGIAAEKYGGSNMFFFPLIRLANALLVPNPDVIEVGMRLVVPDLQRNLNSAGASALIKADMLSTAEQYERERKPNSATRLRSLASRL